MGVGSLGRVGKSDENENAGTQPHGGLVSFGNRAGGGLGSKLFQKLAVQPVVQLAGWAALQCKLEANQGWHQNDSTVPLGPGDTVSPSQARQEACNTR